MSLAARSAPSLIALTAAALCGWLVHAREPRHGLVLNRYSSDDFNETIAPELLDTQVDIDGTPEHPTPAWASGEVFARRTGFLEIPRDGSYVLGVSSTDGSWLYLDDTLVVQNGGIHPLRDARAHLTLRRGLHALRLETESGSEPPTMTLGWRLPAEYSPFEPIPVAVLFPERPEPITATGRCGRLAPWLLVVLAVLLWWRTELLQSLRKRRIEWPAGALLFALALAVRLHGLLAEGETTDQWAYVGAGWIYARNLAAGIFDPVQWMQNREHPNIGKLLYGAAQYVFGDAPWVPNVTAAVLNALTVVVTFVVARRLFGLATAALAGLILALLPSFIAHGRIAALDGPAAFFFTLTVALLVEAVLDEARRTAFLGWALLATGFAIGTKLSNGLLLPLDAGVAGALVVRSRRQTGQWSVPWTLSAFPLLSLVPAIATWPWLWGDTSSHLRTTLHHWSFTPKELYLGTEGAVPADYFAVCFLAVIPIGVLVPFLVGLAQAIRDRGWRLFVVGWMLTPFAWTFTGFRQDGIRYVYSAFPPLAILAALGVVSIAARIGRPVLLPLAATITVYLGWTDLRIHPYYLDYFNELVGGPSGVYQRRLFETGWWSEGLNEAVAFLNTQAPYGASWTLRGVDDHTFVGLRLDLPRKDEDPAFMVTTQLAPGKGPPRGYQSIFEVRAQGAPIVAVYRRE